MRALIQEWPDDALADGALGLMFVDGTGDLVADDGECLD